ncbi:MAG TPA: malectin domain-containing carbohydrate-binding protein [Bryobacteraceae bacterium]|nr:malectin domain-containing carbohydrate-binding protein [Bryobacteraceae bacterium]
MGEGEGVGLSESRALEVRAELNRLLESAAFRGSRRCREFLEYIVEHTVSGPSGTLKERSIGVELFQLPLDFDTGQHTIVRVTANEVRKKLAQHYLAENSLHHSVRIGLPPGSYSAEFTWETQPVETQFPAETPLAETQAPAETQVLAETIPPETPVPVAPRVSAPQGWLTRPVILWATAVLTITAAFSLWGWHAVKPIARDAKAIAAADPAPKTWLGSGDLRMIAGSASSYTDRSGRTWGPDRFFSGGSVFVRPSERIRRTLDPDIYRHVRQGDFRYDIPLQPGSYELRLHFAETGLADFISAESSGEGQRIFRVSANGRPILDLFDVVADADGSNTADVRIFREISPAEDGYLHLSFVSQRGTAILSGIEVLPESSGKVEPVRIRAGWTASWQDPAGQQWLADSYFLGGNALVRTTNPVRNSVLPGMALYASERWGHFSYSVPVPDGRYRVTLKFCEGHYGRGNTGVGGLGSRAFDVYCNGVALLRNFDIFKEAGGGGRPLDRTFSRIQPTAQGKIDLTFVPITGMACVNGIEVTEESK